MAIAYHSPRERPRTVRGTSFKIQTACGNLYLTVNTDEDGLCEMFAYLGKAGGCASGMLEGCMRLASIALAAGLDPKYIAKQLTGIRCHNASWEDQRLALSCLDAIGHNLGLILSGKLPAPGTAPKMPQQTKEKKNGMDKK